MPKPFLAVFLLLALFLSGCLPGAVSAVQAPQFSLTGELEVVAFSPPLIGTGEVTLRLPMTVYNPNPVGVALSRVDFDLYVNGRRALTSAFTDGITLAAQDTRPLVLDVTIPLSDSIELVNDISNLVQGSATSYRLDGSVTVNVLGVIDVFAKTTLVSGQLN